MDQRPLPDGILFGNFLLRLAATFIDILVVAPLGYLGYYFMVSDPVVAAAVTLIVVESLYKPVAEKVYGKTVGKHLLKLKVISQHDFGPISWNQTFTRYLPWAVVAFASIFTTIRFMEDPNFGNFADYREYLQYVQTSRLGESPVLAVINNLPLFSALFIILDPWRRALHDRWAGTYVVFTPPVPPRGQAAA